MGNQTTDCLFRISEKLLINTDKLNLTQITPQPPKEAQTVYPFVFPSFCYDNAVAVAKALSYTSVVYGVAVVRTNSTYNVVEHAWVRNDNNHYDPTYEKQLNNTPEDNNTSIEITYYSLFEIETHKYHKVAQSVGFDNALLVGLEMNWFRNSKLFETYFIV